MMRPYRRIVGRAQWHWMQSCALWPRDDRAYDEQEFNVTTRPPELCAGCLALEDRVRTRDRGNL